MVTFTDADDRRQSYRARTNNSTGETQSMSSFNQNTQNTNDRIEREQRESTNEYINDSSNFTNPNEQLAASLKAAGALTSGALSGQALWDRLPVGMAEYILSKGGDPNLYENEVFSSFAEGTESYSPTGILSIVGPGALYENGELIEGSPAVRTVVNPYSSFDEGFYGSDYWDDYLGEYYGPTERSAYEKNKRWQQKSLGEVLKEGPVGFSDLQRIYGEELSETSANPFAAVSQYNKQGAFSPSFGESIITEYS